MISISHWGMFSVEMNDYFYIDLETYIWHTNTGIPVSWDFEP